ncbi:hypothetical protein GCM10028777_24780 [Angustibacter speluncae]
MPSVVVRVVLVELVVRVVAPGFGAVVPVGFPGFIGRSIAWLNHQTTPDPSRFRGRGVFAARVADSL